MRVLYLTHVDNMYGANRSLSELICALRQFEVEPAVVVPREGDFTDWLDREDIPFLTTNVSWWVGPQTDPMFSPQASHQPLSSELLAFAQNCKPAIVHSNSTFTPDGFYLSRELGCSHVWHLREMCEQHYKFHFHLGREKALELFRQSEACIANSDATRNYYFGDNPRLPSIHTIANPVQAPPKPLARRSTEPPLFCTLGHMSESKNHHDAILALGELKRQQLQAKLTIVGGGDDPYRARCENLVKDLELSSQVNFVKNVEGPWELLSKASCLLQCASHETFGRVTAEAMLAGCPVIARNSGATAELIDDQQTGFLFDDPGELPGLMKKVIENSPELSSITTRARRQARTRFDPKRVAKEVFTVYQGIGDILDEPVHRHEQREPSRRTRR